MRDLLAGPTDTERSGGLGSALPGGNPIGEIRLSNGQAAVDITVAEGAVRSDEVLAVGQVVCTLDARPDVNAVIFISGGQPIEVPRADGSLSEGPLTTADYASLVTDR